jgi:ribonuclease H / adenosylcobalamin/alpha-ribazole phosphatase
MLLLLWAVLTAAPSLSELGPVPSGTLRVVLVRHGQAFTNLDTLPSPAPANPDSLTPLGQEQSARAARALSALAPRLVVHSPAGRARETAERLASAAGLTHRVDARLRPLEMGRGPGGGELTIAARAAEWKAGRDPVPPGGESLEDVGRRVLALVEELRPAHGGQTVVLVAHSEVIAAFVGHVQGKPGAARYPPRAPHASLTVVDATGNGALALRVDALVPEAPASPASP